MLELVMNGVSTRRYARVLPKMADQVEISKSAVSRDTIEARDAGFWRSWPSGTCASWT